MGLYYYYVKVGVFIHDLKHMLLTTSVYFHLLFWTIYILIFIAFLLSVLKPLFGDFNI